MIRHELNNEKVVTIWVQNKKGNLFSGELLDYNEDHLQLEPKQRHLVV